MRKKIKKILKIILIIAVILTLLWMLGIRLLIWFFAQDAFYVGPAAEAYTKYDVTLSDTQSISFGGLTMHIPDDYVQMEEDFDHCVVYNSPDETSSLLIMTPETNSQMALFSAENIAQMSGGFLNETGSRYIMKGFQALGNGSLDTWYTTYKSLLLLTPDDYSFLNWRQGFAYVVSALMKESLFSVDQKTYLYETEDFCGIIRIDDNVNNSGAYKVYVDIFPADDLNTCHSVLFRLGSLNDIYGMLNSITIE